ncbi:hypothetical protein MRX96_028717 [Rhipicephalus microplus]
MASRHTRFARRSSCCGIRDFVGRLATALPVDRGGIFVQATADFGGQDALRMEEGCYIVVCNTSPVFLSLLTEMQRCAIRAFDTSTRRTFVFDDEQ